MKRSYMEKMTLEELGEYAQLLGVATAPAKTVEEAIMLIENKRERIARINVLGCNIEIPLKRAHDKRISDMLSNPNRTDAETEQVLEMLIGKEQMDELTNACTDDDGTVDVNALGFAFVRILTSDELKN